ncbi:MAG: calcium/sodium antiporter [Fidelibacterota bacterium]|nr:MAG: calcium/sodium antiporter [Candidatus Neomarinimicrobiota bacterium]
MLFEIGSVIVGLILLIVGADSLIRGSSGLALRFGISSLVVGLTVVAFGTSAPELVVSLNAAMRGNGQIALGNVIGSNIANIALILGLSALINPIQTQAQLIRRDVPIMILMTVVLVLMLTNGVLGRWEGTILFLVLIGYVGSTVYLSQRERNEAVRETFQQAVPVQPRKPIILLILTLLGLGLLVLGAHLFVKGAVDLARRLAVSDALIGLTLVALGTSLPELATTVVASLQHKNDIAVGNVIGSNIFNILCVLGLTVAISPFAVEGFSVIDLGVMLVTVMLLFPLVRSGFVLSRWEGGLLLAIYVGYMWYLLR